jgi:TM2 domain-containing membrane protein YozV
MLRERSFLILFILLLLLPQLGFTKEDVWRPSPRGALLRAFIFPGWGQFYNHRYAKGVGVLLVETTLVVELAQRWQTTNQLWEKSRSYPPGSEERQIYQDRYLKAEERRNAYSWWTSGFIILSALDAYVDAYLFGFKRDFQERLSLEVGPAYGVKISLRF